MMNRSRSRIGTFATVAIGTALITGTVTLASPASAAPGADAEASRYCATLVAEQKGAPGKLETVRESCSPDSAEEARKGLHAAAKSKLMTWYSDGGYKGKMQDAIYGNDGTCDTAGYAFEPSDDWKDSLSSIEGHGQCNKVRLTNIAGTYSKTFNLDVSFGGEIYNNNVGYVKVWHG
ncbi:hypothetical protein [Streptomyces sp. NPDC054784]